jgi:hypothetical protein
MVKIIEPSGGTSFRDAFDVAQGPTRRYDLSPLSILE